MTTEYLFLAFFVLGVFGACIRLVCGIKDLGRPASVYRDRKESRPVPCPPLGRRTRISDPKRWEKEETGSPSKEKGTR
jgi:hypothetical protein